MLPGLARPEPEQVPPVRAQVQLAQAQVLPVRAQGQALLARALVLSQPGARPVPALLRSGRRCNRPPQRAARR
ncbi:protein of unknown function [Aminobacter niigataensis]|nr:protein of unknown function [Aminobacter niigataensis]